MKQFKLSALLVLSLAGLTACGGSSDGLVKNGVAYNKGDAAKVSETIKTEKDGKVKVVTEKSTVELTMKIKAGKESMTIKEKASGTIKVDLQNKKVEVNLDVEAKSGDQKINETVVVKAEEQEGEFVITSSVGGDLTDNKIDVDQMYEYYVQADSNIYAWNYDDGNTAIDAAYESLADYATAEQVTALVKQLESKIKIAGDVENGNFEIGLSSPFSVNIQNIPVTYTKLKSVYKDGLVDSTVVGIKMTSSQGSTSVSLDMTSTNQFSYTF